MSHRPENCPTMTIEVRVAEAQDVDIWRALRRDGIVRYPSVFIVSLEEHDATPIQQDVERLANGDRFLAFQGDTPVGLVGMNRHAGRAAHRGEVGPMYVIPDAQGSGAASLLLRAVLDYACQIGIWQPELQVNEENTRAIALYQRFGFQQIGRIPNAIIGASGPERDLLFALEIPGATAPG